jgi:signal transduction histidine kinase
MSALPSASPSPELGRVLIVEDDEDIRTSLADALAEHGFVAETARDGSKALEVLASDLRFDVIVLDLMMPVMDGWTFRVRQRADARIAEIPVVAISADVSSKAAAIHADAYLRKPFRAADLVRETLRLISAREARRVREKVERSERLALVGTMVAAIGHEITNPLTYVTANLDELCDSLLPGLRAYAPVEQATRAIEAAHGARHGVGRITSIVQGLRAAVLVPNDRRERVDLRRVMDLAIEVAGAHIRSRARLERVYEQIPPVMANEAQLVQIALNLLVNAAQAFSTTAPARNTITAFVGPMDGGVAFEVRDNGPGIAAADRARLFEPFFTTKPDTGTGMGLIICRQLAESYGGRIEVESEPGRGATFRVVFPAEPPSH